jgi:EAL domain-containing protein (putative c-di-GMP-specific phosphodiesterase class I)
MYAAKRNGKNQVMFFTESLGSSVRERLTLESELSNAISNGEITVHYQPEFELSTGQLIRFEALARWDHATLGAIPPEKFIPVAEDGGLIVSLGAYVMERACEEAVKWQPLSENPVQVAVNVSSIQFARESFVNEVLAILAKTGLRPELLQIELTESAMLNGVERVAHAIQRLREAGVTVAIDDFGTGYSCLSYLPRLSFDALKIDRSFVREIGTRAETKAMVHALVTLAHNLGMKVIVEGIETAEQLREVRALGGNEVQGFLLGRPNADPAATLREQQARLSATDIVTQAAIQDASTVN